jgi:hypothetical protein
MRFHTMHELILHSRATLRVPIVCCLGMSLFSLGFAGSYNGPNPSPHQIDSLWRALYGSPVHQGIVVYNKMSGGTTSDVSKDTVCIMRLVSDSNKATIKSLFYYKQAQTWNNMFGSYSGYRISPDGAKIACFNNSVVQVADTNGANIKVIKTVNLNTDMLALSWDDSANTRRLVYSIGSIIVRTVINENNTGGKSDTLWSHDWGKDPVDPAKSGIAYTSVNKSGHFLCFNMQNTNCNVNLPIMVDLSSKTAKNPTGCGDGCQVRMVMDGTGTMSYHENTHLTATTLWQWPSTKLGSVPCPNGQTNNCSDCGDNFFYWCDSDTNFMAQAGDNTVSASPGCYTKAFIRKGKTTSARMMYLGDYIGYPALWIDPKPFGTTGTLDRPATSIEKQRVSITLAGRELTLRGTSVDQAIIYGLNGAVAARGGKRPDGAVRLSLSSMAVGTYLLTWREGISARSRYITVSR